MVDANHTGIITTRVPDRFWWRLGYVTVYLFFILVKIPKLKQSPEAIVLGLVSGLVAIYFLIQWKWEENLIALIYAAGIIGLLSAVSKVIAKLVAQGWMFLGHVMGKVVGSVLLTVVYFFILTPISLLQKMFSGKGKFKSDTSIKSVWLKRKHQFSRSDLEELW